MSVLRFCLCVCLMTLFSSKTIAQDFSYFENETFNLQNYIVDGVLEDVDLTHPYTTSQNRNRPYIIFKSENDVLNLEITGYCNYTSSKYQKNDTYFKVLERGGTTLQDCGGDEEVDLFNPITGYIYTEDPARKVYYEISEDEKYLTLWTNENHKLVFSKESLSTKNYEFESTLQVYPNPASKIVSVTNELFLLTEVSLYTMQGKQLLTIVSNFKAIDVSNLKSGIYLLKIKSEGYTTRQKLIIK